MSFDPTTPPEWVAKAVCASTDPELFFVEFGGGNKAAERICSTCPVKAECLEYALDNNEEYGVWGGVGSHGRRLIKRARRRAA